MIKRIGLASLLLFSCSRPHHWAVDQIHSDKAEYSFAKISCPALDPVNGIDIEFVYRNNLKNREFGKESPQNCDSERVTIAQEQGTSENHNSEAKPTPPKPDSSGCFGINHSDQIQAYLTVHSTPVEPLKGDPQSVAVSVRSAQEKFSCTAYRFQGGQKFLLPSEIAEKIISLLKNKQEVTILLNGYRTVLKPADFEQKYETFLHPLPLRNPFQFSL